MGGKRSFRSTFHLTPQQRNVMSKTEPARTQATKDALKKKGNCATCFTTVSEQNLRYDCANCQSSICNDCLRRYAQHAVRDSTMLPLRCPGEMCNSPILHLHLLNILDAKHYKVITKPPITRENQPCVLMSTEDFQNYQKLMKLAAIKGWKNCPNCNVLVDKNGGCGSIHCRCGRTFDWHAIGSKISGHNFPLAGHGVTPFYRVNMHRRQIGFSSVNSARLRSTNPKLSSARPSRVRVRGFKRHISAHSTGKTSPISLNRGTSQQNPKACTPHVGQERISPTPTQAGYVRKTVVETMLGEAVSVNHAVSGRTFSSKHAEPFAKVTGGKRSCSTRNPIHRMTTRSKAKSASKIGQQPKAQDMLKPSSSKRTLK
ncbi:E3 ubiquitin-protein ligase RNF217 [Gracilaria domingensis]|nr:E3 ubiquitin-protein ligase RNF217 [Gracilaria domingensis]